MTFIVSSSTHGKIDGFVNRSGQNVAAIVVGMLANEVDAAGRPHNDLGFCLECFLEFFDYLF